MLEAANREMVGSKQEETYFNVQIEGEDSTVIDFAIKSSSSIIGDLKRIYCERIRFETNSITLLYDGRRLNYEDTPESLQLQENDIIEAYQNYPHLHDWPKAPCCTNYMNCYMLRTLNPEQKLKDEFHNID